MRGKKAGYLFVGLTIVILFGVVYLFRGQFFRGPFLPSSSKMGESPKEKDVEVIAENLEIPWEVVFLPASPARLAKRAGGPEGSILVSERPGRIWKIFAAGGDRKVIEIEGVEHVGEGGLLGMAFHPQFKENGYLYLYLTTKQDGGLVNQVERYRLRDNKLEEKKIIIEGIKGAAIHDGGRIAFGPDGYLYITTGDAGEKNLAQDKSSLNGKILRLKDDGSIPEDNPFGNAVYSFGHRNSQGLAWDDQGRLWATEHGRSGAQSGFDELNLLEKGKNYGWPAVQGPETKEGMASPVIQSGDETWAPAGAVFYAGSIFFGGLRGESLYEYNLEKKELARHFKEEFGRIRAVVLGPDGYFYLTTSNRDGRGKPRVGDDKLIRINPEIFTIVQ